MKATISNEHGPLGVVEDRKVVKELVPGFAEEWEALMDTQIHSLVSGSVKESGDLITYGDATKYGPIRDLEDIDFEAELARQGYEMVSA